jgi:hypothetical protein
MTDQMLIEAYDKLADLAVHSGKRKNTMTLSNTPSQHMKLHETQSATE